MTNRIKGTVTAAAKSKFGYFVQLAEAGGAYFNSKYEPKCNEGDVVGIEYHPKKNGQPGGNISKLKVLEKNANPRSRTTSSASGAGSDSRQDSIVWQHSQEMAIRAAPLFIEQGAYKVGGKTPDDKMGVLASLIDGLTVNYFRDAIDPRSSTAFKDSAEVDADVEWEGGVEEGPAPTEQESDDEWASWE